MKIKREINGVVHEFELTNDEMYAARKEVQDELAKEDIVSRLSTMDDFIRNYYGDRTEQEINELIPEMVDEYQDRMIYNEGWADVADAAIEKVLEDNFDY